MNFLLKVSGATPFISRGYQIVFPGVDYSTYKELSPGKRLQLRFPTGQVSDSRIHSLFHFSLLPDETGKIKSGWGIAIPFQGELISINTEIWLFKNGDF